MHVSVIAIRTRSGADVFFEDLAKGLEDRGLDINVVWLPQWLQWCPWFLRCLRLKQSDHVISNVEYGGYLRLKGAQLSVSVQQCVFDTAYQTTTTLMQKIFHRTILWWGTRQSLRVAKHVLCSSNATKQQLENAFGFMQSTVVLNGVDPADFSPIAIRTDETSICRILFVGNLIQRKGIDLLPEIMQKLGNQYLLLYTTGKRDAVIPKSFQETNMQSLGSVPYRSMPSVYASADICIFPSRHEGLSFAQLEAMASGLPCVVSNAPAVQELVEDGVHGYVCKHEDPNLYAQKIQELWSDPDLRRAMSEANRKNIVENYTLKQCIDSYYQIITCGS